MYDRLLSRSSTPDAPAMYFSGRHISYRKFFERTEAVTEAFMRRGFARGDVITLALPNIPVAVYIFYAANRLGITVCLVHPLEPVDRIAALSAKVGSKAVFLFDETAQRNADRLDRLPCSAVFCSVSDNITAFEGFFYNIAAAGKRNKINRLVRSSKNKKGTVGYYSLASFLSNKEEPGADRFKSSDPSKTPKKNFPAASVVMNSGGTEGVPKTVLLSDEAFNISSDNIINAISGEKDAPVAGMLALLPMFHAFGLGVVFHLVFTHGYEAVLLPKYSPAKIARYIKTGKVRYLAGVPTVYKGLVLQKDFDCKNLSKLVAAFCGGDALDEKTREAFDSLIVKHGGSCRLYQGYGLTETAGVFCVNKAGLSRPGSVGTPIGENYDVIIMKDGRKAEPGEVGEICLCSPSLMISYYEGKAGDSSVFFEYEGRKYLKTGDLGKKDADGFLYFCERIKRMTKVSGVNVFPSQVEEVLRLSPYVSDAAVKAVPNERKGNVIVAYVILKAGAGEEQARRDMEGKCMRSLNKWSRPVEYRFIERLPRTPIGKVDYKALDM